jgi:hypothetical protein
MALNGARSHESLIAACQIIAGNLEIEARFDPERLSMVMASLPESATVAERVVVVVVPTEIFAVL